MQPIAHPEDQPWFPFFCDGFTKWMVTEGTLIEPLGAIKPLHRAGSLGHRGSALLLANIFRKMASGTPDVFSRMALVYQIAAFWCDEPSPDTVPGQETQDDWDRALATPTDPRVWDAIALLHTDGKAGMVALEALIATHPRQAGLLAAIAADIAAGQQTQPWHATELRVRARQYLIKSAGAGSRAAQQRLFAYGDRRA